MDREIIFRGKYKISGEWMYGDLEHHDKGSVFIRYWHCGTYTSYEVDSSTVCQYTGLTDKNGRKIFEGDIVKREIFGSDVIGKVVWFDIGFCGFYLKHGNSFYPIGGDEYTKKCDDEVIGNIFDNPELLEGGAE